MKRFHNHPILIKIKQAKFKFSFQSVSVHTVKEIEGLPSNKATAGEIPINILKESGFTFEYLTSCVNEAISSGIVSVHKKKDPTDKWTSKCLASSLKGIRKNNV